MQASQHLCGRFLDFADLRHELSRLCGPTLVTGTTGCGKTLGIINPLAARLAALNPDDAGQKAAVVYFNCKGRGDTSFLEALPPARRAEVVRVTSEEGLCLFPQWAWKSHGELAQAVAAFFPELGRLLHATEFEFGSHFVYWQNLRDQLLRYVSGLEVADSSPEGGFRANALAAESHFLAVLERTAALLEDVDQRRAPRNPLSNPAIAGALASRFGTERWKTALELMRTDFGRAMELGEGVENLRLRAEWISFFKTDPAMNSIEEATLSVWEEFAEEYLPESLRESALTTALGYAGLAQGTWESIAGEVRGLVDPFRNGTGRSLFAGSLSFEQIVDEGLIVVIDLPAAGMAGAHRAALLALLFSFMNTVLGRYQRLNHAGTPINQRRPVVLVLDEFHSLLTRGRDEGFELFLSRCREFGCIALLATQNLRLVASALGNTNKFESLLGLFGTCFFGANSDALTNAYASLCCGQEEKGVRAAAVDFGLGNRKLGEWLKTNPTQADGPRFTPESFARLRPGEFVVRAADGSTGLFDCFAPR